MEHLRDSVRRVLNIGAAPMARALLALGIAPNQVSVAGVALNLVAAALVVSNQLALAGVVFLAAGAMDYLDGTLARLAKMASASGAFLDSTLDRISEGVLFAAIAYHLAVAGQAVDSGLAVLALLGSALVSYTRARAESLGLECKVGFATRGERVVLIALGLLSGLVAPAIYLLVVLTAITVAQRIDHALRQFRAQTLSGPATEPTGEPHES